MQGFSSGAPPGACEDGTDLVPGHVVQPSTDPLPYEVDISEFVCQSYIPTKTYKSKCSCTNSALCLDINSVT